MVPNLLIRNCETNRFLIEHLCLFQVIEIKFNPDESCFDWLHRMSSGFRIATPAPDTSRDCNGDVSPTENKLMKRGKILLKLRNPISPAASTRDDPKRWLYLRNISAQQMTFTSY